MRNETQCCTSKLISNSAAKGPATAKSIRYRMHIADTKIRQRLPKQRSCNGSIDL